MEANTLLHRQIHPNFIQNGVISSQTFLVDSQIFSVSFIPNANDEGKLSVYNGAKFSAQQAFFHYTGLKRLSSGVLSVTREEVDSVKDLSAYEDNNPFDGHSVIDYSKVETKNLIKKKAIKLKNLAVSRGWTHKG